MNKKKNKGGEKRERMTGRTRMTGNVVQLLVKTRLLSGGGL